MSRRVRLTSRWRRQRLVSSTIAATLAMVGAIALTGCSSRETDDRASSGAAAVDQARLEVAAPDSGQWMSTGRTYDEQRFSPLTSINAGNVGKLSLAASWEAPGSMGLEATPIVVDGTMYVSSDFSQVHAIDAATGKLRWSYDPDVRRSLVKACCGAVNRGVAVWRGMVFVGALDGRLIALDAATGKVRWQTVTVDQSKPYSITGAPRVIRGKVIIGNGGADLGVRGYVSAYDAETGKLAWRFYTVPGQPGTVDHAASDAALRDHAAPTWFGEFWKLGGGGTVWDSMAYDPALNLLYVGTGNGAPWNHGVRSQGKGDNLFLSSIVALRPDTGEYVWHYQTTPGESWDFTATQHIILADLTIGGQLRHVAMQAPKNGYLYVLDRATGKLISATPIVPMTWSKGVDLVTGRPIENPASRYYKTGKPFLMAPSGLGAHNWHPMSFSPQTGLVYIPVQQLPVAYVDARNQPSDPKKINSGADYSMQVPPPALAPQGWLAAWNPVTGKEVWRVKHPVPTNGGVLSTAGGLVFQGDAQGKFSAYAARTGAPLWSFDAQSGVVAAPISYAVGGQQYVAVMAGWGGSLALVGGARAGAIGTNRLLIFSIGGTAKLPPKPAEAVAPLDPPADRQDAAEVQRGARDYFAYCSRCHGVSAISGGVTPDLRHSNALKSDVWYDILLHGALADGGMANFSGSLDRQRASDIRAYVIDAAQKEKADTHAPASARRPATTGSGL